VAVGLVVVLVVDDVVGRRDVVKGEEACRVLL